MCPHMGECSTESGCVLCTLYCYAAGQVHERSMESDFLLMVLRDLLRRRPSLRLILMSATLNTALFADYFGGPGRQV